MQTRIASALLVLAACSQAAPPGRAVDPPEGEQGDVPGGAGADVPVGAGGAAGGGGAAAVGEGSASLTASGTRLKARVLVSTDGAQLFLGWRDTERNEDCDFAAAADGKMRCVPLSAGVSPYYSDSACTAPLALATKGCTAPKYVTLAAGAACTAAPRALHQVAAAVSPTTVYVKSGSSCSPVTPAPATADYYPIGAEVLPSLFVEATEQLR